MKNRKFISVFLCLAIVLTTCLGMVTPFVSNAAGNVLYVGADQTFKTPQAAFDAASDGDTIYIYADSVYYGTDSKAVINKNNLRIIGLARNGINRPHMKPGDFNVTRAAYGDNDCKGVWLVTGNNNYVENIEFSDMRLSSSKGRNGSGIMIEGIGFTAKNCYFHNCDDGVRSLSYSDAQLTPACSIVLENCEFGYNGHGDGYEHNMYIGRVYSFTLKNSYSHHALNGHLVKTRALRNYIMYNRLTDEYAPPYTWYSIANIDIPDGGLSYVIGNLIHQGEGEGYDINARIVEYETESTSNAALFSGNDGHRLYVVNNTMANDMHDYSAQFVYVPDSTVCLAPAVIKNNIFVGHGGETYYVGNVDASNNVLGGSPNMFYDFTNYDYRLVSGATTAINQGINLSSVSTPDGTSLVPAYQYVHKISAASRSIVGGIIDIGAYEYDGSTPNAAVQPTTYKYEAENLAVANSSGKPNVLSSDYYYPNGTWPSNGKMMDYQGTVVGDYVTYSFNAPTAGTYRIKVGFQRTAGAGNFQTYIDGAAQGGEIPGYVKVFDYTYLDIGRKVLSAGTHTIKFQCTAPSNEGAYHMYIDYIELVPVTDFNTIIVDNRDVEYSEAGTGWKTAADMYTEGIWYGFNGPDYRFNTTPGSGNYAKFTPNIQTSGLYNVYMKWGQSSLMSNSVPLEVAYNGGTSTDTSITLNQKMYNRGQWNYVGTYNMNSGTGNYVKLTVNGSGQTSADAVVFEKTTAVPTVTPTPTPPPPVPTPSPSPLPVATPGTWYSKTGFTAGGYGLGTTNNSIPITLDFDAVPTTAQIDGVIGYTGTYTQLNGYSSLPVIVRFSTTGTIDARNGGGYAADATVPYVANTSYHFKIVANLSSRSYDVWVTPNGGSSTKIATSYAFRSDAPAISDIGKIDLISANADNQFYVQNHTINGASTTPAPTPTPTPTPTLNAAAIDHALQFARQQLNNTVSEASTSQYARSTNANGTWAFKTAADWTSGFFPGLLWNMYQDTGNTTWKTNAENWTVGLDSQKNDTTSHDVGFKIFSSFGNGYRLTNNAAYKSTILTAAGSLATRYNATVGCIKSWDGTQWTYPVIIDNMMNLELLFWGSQNGGQSSWYNMALSHALKTATNNVRADGSTYHVVDYNPSSGSVTFQGTSQGYSDSSTWARGQAWAISGFTMAYRYTNDSRMLDTAKKVADYYVNNMPSDGIPLWDFNAPAGSERDTSAAAIAASGLLELSTFVTDQQLKAKYSDAAGKILSFLCSQAYLAEGTNSHGILLHGVGNYPATSEINVSLIYGDYYFTKALLQYKMLGVTPTPSPSSAPTPTPTLTPTPIPAPTPTPSPVSGNLALGKTASASEQALWDGIVTKVNDGDSASAWYIWNTAYPQWVKIDLGSSYAIGKTELEFQYGTVYSFKYKVEVSNDDINYTTVADKSSNITKAVVLTDTFSTVNAHYVRVTITGCSDSNHAVGINEYRIFAPDVMPTPSPAPTPSPTPALSNLALNKTVTASDEAKWDGVASRVNDGDTASGWYVWPNTYPQWVKIDLANLNSISKFETIFGNYPSFTYGYKIEVSSDDVNYTTVVDKSSNTTILDVFTDQITQVKARYVRITVTNCTNPNYAVRINELRVFGQ